jgi:signal peptidase II
VDAEAVGPGAVDPDAVGPDAVDPDAVDPDAVDPDVVDPDVVDPGVVDPDARGRRLTSLCLAVAAAVLLADQLTKTWAVATLSGRGRVAVLGDLFGLHLARNSGAAFSMATGSTWLFTLIAAVVIVVVIRTARRLSSPAWALTLGLLLGGALGNFSDRLFRAPGFGRGHVVDFLELPHWPIFNVADSCVVTAAVLIAVLSLRGVPMGSRPNA